MYYGTATMEPWQWLYLFVIGYTTLPLMTAIVSGLSPRVSSFEIPLWLTLPAALGALILFTPYGWLMAWFLIVLLLGNAPLAPALFGSVFLVTALVASFCETLHLPEIWRRARLRG
jgi:hypothetical protein